jgi:GNAT superfamily N-acetyltransferase
MTAIVRDYAPEDLARATELVNQAWDFDGNIANPMMADLAKDLYVNGSLAASRHYRVVEEDGDVVGLLFGAAGEGPLYPSVYRGFRGTLRTLGKLFRVPDLTLREKLRWLGAMRSHEVARLRAHRRSDAEVTLLAVDAAMRGRGFGRQLMDEYVAVCRSLGKSQVTVETDVHSSFGFYQHYGFVLAAEFNSPLNERFTGGSGEAFVYALDL